MPHKDKFSHDEISELAEATKTEAIRIAEGTGLAYAKELMESAF